MYGYHTCCIACFYFQRCHQKRGTQEHWPPSLSHRQVFEPCIFHIMYGWTIRHTILQVVRKFSFTVAIHTYSGDMNDRSSKYMNLTIQTSNFSISNRHCRGEIKLLSKKKSERKWTSLVLCNLFSSSIFCPIDSKGNYSSLWVNVSWHIMDKRYKVHFSLLPLQISKGK